MGNIASKFNPILIHEGEDFMKGRLLPAIVIAAALQASSFAQQGVEQLQKPGAVKGVVLRASTREPLPNVRVVLNKVGPVNNVPFGQAPLTMLSDANGRFAFSDLEPGRYQLLGTRDGYVRAAYGQRSPNGPGAPITLSAGQEINDLVLTMTPTGTITGRVVTRGREPAGNIDVKAHRYTYRAGRKVLSDIQTARTNDLGEYRLYYLTPGEYVLSAAPAAIVRSSGQNANDLMVEAVPGISRTHTTFSDSVIASPPVLAALGILSPGDQGETYVPVFYPGVTESASAIPVDVQPGQTFHADFTITATKTVSISGRVLNAETGEPPKDPKLVLLPKGGDVDPTRPQAPIRSGISASGEFTFRGLSPGKYELIGYTSRGSRGPFTGSGIGAGATLNPIPLVEIERLSNPPSMEPLRAALVLLDVSNDVKNIALALQEGFRIDGSITIEGLSPGESEAMTRGLDIQLTRDDSFIEFAPNQAFVGDNGSFTVTGVFPGTYQIGIMGATTLGTGLYHVKSVRYGNADAMSPRLIIEGEPQGRRIEIVIGGVRPAVTAIVTDDKQIPAAGVTVALVPTGEPLRWDKYVYGTTDDSGKATVINVKPGDYEAYAWEEVQIGAWWDPDFLRKYSGRGKPVRVLEGIRSPTVDLQVIPYAR
jgi:hypothetical protein